MALAHEIVKEIAPVVNVWRHAEKPEESRRRLEAVVFLPRKLVSQLK
jgi:hypothetical protein